MPANRCGGPRHCKDCALEVVAWDAEQNKQEAKPSRDLSYLPEEERRRALALEMAMESFPEGMTSTDRMIERATKFAYFLKWGS